MKLTQEEFDKIVEEVKIELSPVQIPVKPVIIVQQDKLKNKAMILKAMTLEHRQCFRWWLDLQTFRQDNVGDYCRNYLYNNLKKTLLNEDYVHNEQDSLYAPDAYIDFFYHYQETLRSLKKSYPLHSKKELEIRFYNTLQRAFYRKNKQSVYNMKQYQNLLKTNWANSTSIVNKSNSNSR